MKAKLKRAGEILLGIVILTLLGIVGWLWFPIMVVREYIFQEDVNFNVLVKEPPNE